MNQKFKLEVGQLVTYQSLRCVIEKIINIDTLLLTELDTKLSYTVTPHEITPIIQHKRNKDLVQVKDDEWQKIQFRFEIIQPLLEIKGRSRALVQERADLFGLSTNTLYRWIRNYEATGIITALARKNRIDAGVNKLTPEIEEIINEVIKQEYLNTQIQRKSIRKVYIEIKRKCLEQSLTPPHEHTIRNRISLLADELKLARKSTKKEAQHAFSPIKGTFPDADFPLSVIQIDHTKLDIILVDDYYRRPIGRPWITLAIDVFSRMVTGFYISFDPPGAFSTGLCLAHSIISKEQWLSKYNIDATWPCWGVPKRLHLDNAKEFRGKVLGKACQQYGVAIEWRPVARPHFGGHIERLLGTFSKEIHNLPGTTFSNTQERKGYDSEKNATFTLTEFEIWLTTYITQIYHQRIHSSLGVPPIERYKEGVLGSKHQPGVGFPPKVMDETRLRLDFMPFEERTVQNYGVAMDEVHYWHDVLRPWIKATEPSNRKIKRKFVFRRDPRDISTVWFFDPELQTYFAIPYRDGSHPPMSIWELREAKKHLKSIGRENYDERAIFEAYDRLKTIEETAKGKTSAVRRAQQRRTHLTPVIKPEESKQNISFKEKPLTTGVLSVGTIKPFDDLDDLS